MPALLRADYRAPLADSGLPPEIQRATIVYNGRLTDDLRGAELQDSLCTSVEGRNSSMIVQGQ